MMIRGESGPKQINTKSFTREVNLFDANLADPDFIRYFEQYSSKVEASYPWVTKGLKKESHLSQRNYATLLKFVTNLFIRQSSTREEFLMRVLEDEAVRKKLFNEITLFSDTREEDLKLFELIHSSTPSNEQMNLFAGEIWTHLVRVFRAFDFTILKAREGTCWFTSDNPVIVDRRGSEEAWIIPAESEIYFPISRDYLLFMYHPEMKSDNRIRNFEIDSVTECPDDIQHDIISKIISPSAERYLIMGMEFKESDYES